MELPDREKEWPVDLKSRIRQSELVVGVFIFDGGTQLGLLTENLLFDVGEIPLFATTRDHHLFIVIKHPALML